MMHTGVRQNPETLQAFYAGQFDQTGHGSCRDAVATGAELLQPGSDYVQNRTLTRC